MKHQFENMKLGMKVVRSPLALKQESRKFERTWRERWFTLPWRPKQTHEFRNVMVPTAIRQGDTMFIHPELYKELQES